MAWSCAAVSRGPCMPSLPAELIAKQPEMAHLQPGVVHDIVLVENRCDKQAISAPSTDRNRDAYARSAVLYGWAQGADSRS